MNRISLYVDFIQILMTLEALWNLTNVLESSMLRSFQGCVELSTHETEAILALGLRRSIAARTRNSRVCVFTFFMVYLYFECLLCFMVVIFLHFSFMWFLWLFIVL